MPPTTDYEWHWRQQGYQTIAGIDEAGRGCWAGPVVAAAVVLSQRALEQPTLIAGIDDSKTLTAKRREAMYIRVSALADAVGVGVVPAFVIDAFGIVAATRLAMIIALLRLPCQVDALLIDALTLDTIPLPQQALIKGDARCVSIAAASIIAKVSRDRAMRHADLTYPGYGFAAHKGYGTALHHRMLHHLGPCPLHRLTFRPVTEIALPFT